jgi:hypothetical protein
VTTERGIYTGRLIPPIFFGTANNSCPAEVESQMRLYTCDMASPYEGTPPPLSTVTVGHMIGLFDRMYRAPTPLTPAMFGISRSDRLFWVLLRRVWPKRSLSLPKKTAGVAESVTENTVGRCISAVIQHLRGCLSTVALAGPACGTESRSRERNSIQIATHRGIDVSEM